MKFVKKGLLFVIDGTDGAGKKTQSDLLLDRLIQEGYETKLIDFPKYGQPSAAMVEKYLRGEFGEAKEIGPYVPSIFYATDRFDSKSEMKEWLKKGGIWISNRYMSASMGHQAGKIKGVKERNNYLNWLDNLEFEIFGIPRPDLTLLLFMPTKVSQKLVDKKGHRDYVGGAKRDIHEADAQHLIDAAEAYKYVAEKFKWPIIDCAPDGTIDSLKTPKQIHEEIYKIIKQKLVA